MARLEGGARGGENALGHERQSTNSQSAWNDFERLLGEEGRGKSPSGNGARSVTPSRSSSQLSQWSAIGNEGSRETGRQPSTPKTEPAYNLDDDDRHATPRGLSRQVASQALGTTRPLHTPPQLLPPSSGALRPPSAQSQSSSSSTYSLDDNSWATALAPPLLDDDFRHAQARPLSEFDFAAAYARSDGEGSLPNSPMMPTVGVVQPASPVAADHFDSTRRSEPTAPTPSSRSEHDLHAFPDASESASHSPPTSLLPTKTMTPTSSRAPSPTPSLSPNFRPSSRASSSRSVSSPVRPPRRQASQLTLAQKSNATSSAHQQTPPTASSSRSPPEHTYSTPREMPASVGPNEAQLGADTPSPTVPSRSTSTGASPQGSPRAPPPNIPEKSRRRASTLGLGLRRGDGIATNEARDAGDGFPGPTFGNGLNENIATSAHSGPDTPLSASDFADVYVQLDAEWDARSTTSSRSPSIVVASKETSPDSTRSKPSSQRIRNGSVVGDVLVDADVVASLMMPTDRETLPTNDAGQSQFEVNCVDSVVTSESSVVTPPASRRMTSKADAKARAEAFIADLKKSRQDAEVEEGEADRPVGEGLKRGTSIQDRPEVDEAALIGSAPEDLGVLPSHASHKSESVASSQAHHRHLPSFRSSTAPLLSRTQTRSDMPPLLRRRPLPMAIQATGELQKARTAGERARIYAAKINELGRETSRLDEWMDLVRNPRSAVARASAASPTASPVRTSRSFRHEGSSATFAPRGDGYRAREIISTTFATTDIQPSAPFPGVLAYNSNGPSRASSVPAANYQRTLGSGLPAASVSFFSRSLGRRTSKRAPPAGSILHSPSSGAGGGGGGIGRLPPISSPRAVVGPRMPSSSLDGSTVDQSALTRLQDVLPQASIEDLRRSLMKAGGSDDVLAISIYLSEREAAIGK